MFRVLLISRRISSFDDITTPHTYLYSVKKKGFQLQIDPDAISVSPEQLEQLINRGNTKTATPSLSYKERQKVKAGIRKDMLERNKKHQDSLAQKRELRHSQKGASAQPDAADDRWDEKDDDAADAEYFDVFKSASDDQPMTSKKRKMAKFLSDEPPEPSTPPPSKK